MDRMITLGTSTEAIRAELHRSDLLREAAISRRFRVASDGMASKVVASPGFVRRVRTAFAGLGRPAQADCADCV
jgi:hypothetical protein